MSLMSSGAAFKITARETEPIIWFKPIKESGKGESFNDRLLQAVKFTAKVNYKLKSSDIRIWRIQSLK